MDKPEYKVLDKPHCIDYPGEHDLKQQYEVFKFLVYIVLKTHTLVDCCKPDEDGVFFINFYTKDDLWGENGGLNIFCGKEINTYVGHSEGSRLEDKYIIISGYDETINFLLGD